jgi:hypothetical protein
MWAAAVIQREQPRLVYLAVRGVIKRASHSARATNSVAARRPIDDTVPVVMPRATPTRNAAQPIVPQRQDKSESPAKKEKLHRRTISDTLKRQKQWQVTSKVDGSIDFSPPRGISVDAFAAEVRSAVEAMGYKPTVRIGRGAGGHSVVRVHTPETLAQAPRGAHDV